MSKGGKRNSTRENRRRTGQEAEKDKSFLEYTVIIIRYAHKDHPEFLINTVYNTHNTVGTFDHNSRHIINADTEQQ